MKEAKQHRHFKIQYTQEIEIINLEGRNTCIYSGGREGENVRMWHSPLLWPSQVREAL